MADIKNNEVHLCDSCCYDYPSCDVSENDVWFGDGKGCDNICCCNKYEPIVLKAKK